MTVPGTNRTKVWSFTVAIAILWWAGAPVQSVKAQDASAAVSDTPYDSIVARNIFGLLPIVKPDPGANQPPADPPPKITPDGIMTIFGRDQALFKVANKPKPGQPVKEDSYVLAEGERQDGIEVVKINHLDGVITFNNHGTVQELALIPAKESRPPSAMGGGSANPSNSAITHRPFRPGMGMMAPAVPGTRAGSGAYRGGGAYDGTNPMGAGYESPHAQQSQQNIENNVINAARDMAIIEHNRIVTQGLVNQGKLPSPAVQNSYENGNSPQVPAVEK